MSQEKVNALTDLGAEVHRTPTEAASSSPLSNLSVAARLTKEIPHAVMLDQYNNGWNPKAHEEGTGREIVEVVERSGGKVDVFVAGVGTGGTVSGIAKVIKERHHADCRVVSLVGPHLPAHPH